MKLKRYTFCNSLEHVRATGPMHALIKTSQLIRLSPHFDYILLKQSFDINNISNVQRFIKKVFNILRLKVK